MNIIYGLCVKRLRVPLYFVIFLILGCVNTEPLPNSHYYLLDEPQSTNSHFSSPLNDVKNNQVKVNLVTVADYLAQPNLVMKLDNHQITIANYHSWGEDLPSAIQRLIIKDLNARYQHTVFLESCLNCTELSVYVEHFYPSQNGDTIISGSYEIAYDNGVNQRQDFMYKVEQNQPGYLQSVKNMRVLLRKLADSIELRVMPK